MRLCCLAFLDFQKNDAVKSHVWYVYRAFADSEKVSECKLISIGTGKLDHNDQFNVGTTLLFLDLRTFFIRFLFYGVLIPFRLSLQNLSKFNLIYIRYSPFFVFLLVYLRLFSKSKIIIEINGIFNNEYNVNNLYTKTVLYINNLIERVSYKLSDQVISVTPEIKSYIIKNFAVGENKIFVAPNGVNVEDHHVDHEAKKYLRQKFGVSENSIVFGFIGNFAGWQGIDLAISGFEEANIPNSFLVLIGDGPDLKKYKQFVGQNKLGDRVIFTGQVPISESAKYISMFDIGLLLKKPMESGYSPLKLYSYLACSVPVVATNLDSFMFINDKGLGWLSFSTTASISSVFKKVALEFFEESDFFAKRKDLCRDYVKSNHDWKIIVETILTRLDV